MATQPEIAPPDTIEPQSPPEMPPAESPSENPSRELPGFNPVSPDRDEPHPPVPETPPPPD